MPDKPPHVADLSPDTIGPRMEALRDLFPEALTEARLDFAKLRAALGDFVDDTPERYSFSWAGKRDAIRLLQLPSRATLLPAPDESLDWDTTQNLFIEGENLEALKLLLRPYYGRVKMIYIDPPYNTGNDFVYPDDYRDPLGAYLEQTGQVKGQGDQTHRNQITSGRKHSGWLSMMYPRLWLARQLLRDDGVIFISIDDNEVHNLRMVMNEVFGEENFVAQIAWKNVYGGGAKVKHVVQQHEYVLLYARAKELIGAIELPPEPEARKRYTERDGKFATRGPYFTQPLATTSMDPRPNLRFPILWQGNEIWPDKQWQWSKARVEEALANDELVIRSDQGKWSVRYKQYLRDEDGNERASKLFSVLNGPWTQVGTADVVDLMGDNKLFAFPKPAELIGHLLSMGWRDGDAIILDFFAGSCTTAQAVLELNHEDGGNRRFIMVQLPEPTGREDFPTIADIGKERIRRVVARMKNADTDKHDLPARDAPEDLGFRVFKLAPSTYRNWAGVDAADDADLPDRYAAQMELHGDGLADGWTPEAVIAEVALKEAGFGLGYAVEPLADSLWRVTDHDTDRSFIISLADDLRLEDVEPLGLDKETLLVCRATALDDTTAGNLELQCRLRVI